ncbi:hypothetical protein M4578_07325 [Salipiger sp. P9]|uniref:hypothetical protein n=1 Tax=Salipiger pentaromativorans TaxID=2943193 RepID=UPI002157A314|nr:hypothetical protein [Salipiger pentaromativorans]MCR8547635.1 hypothetical protein [Salipiger pentaromativorans]
MFRIVLSAVGLTTAMLVGFSFLMGISKMDVSIKHEMQRHVVAEPFEAGDIVALSPDGQRLEGLLCSLDLRSPARRDSEIRARYYNMVDDTQERFFRYVRAAKALFGLPAEDGAPADNALFGRGLTFTGEVSRVVGQIEERMPVDCWCNVARAVVERKNKACVVEKSLVETTLEAGGDGHRLRTTVGISFRPEPILVSDPSALAAMCPTLNTRAVAPKDQDCGGTSGFTFDVVARAKVGLIREAPIPGN